jgi:hypothetical protein
MSHKGDKPNNIVLAWLRLTYLPFADKKPVGQASITVEPLVMDSRLPQTAVRKDNCSTTVMLRKDHSVSRVTPRHIPVDVVES